MNRFRTKTLVFALGTILAGIVAFSACDREEPDDSGREFPYKVFAVGTEGSRQIVLDKLSGPVKSIVCSASWLSAEPCGELPEGSPIIVIRNTDGNGAEATVTVTASRGDKAVITVQHQKVTDGDAYSGGNANFITDWWTMENIPLEGFDTPQAAPWTPEGGVHIPKEIRYQYLPEDGWEMAFSYINQPNLKGVRMFGLYNKWTGQLRVYTYLVNTTGWGSELQFCTYFGESGDSVMYPFYHALQYGIPTSHVPGQSILRNAQLFKNQPQTFLAWVSPFMRSDSLQEGWYVVEYDMSGFVPEGQTWPQNNRSTPLSFLADTKSNASITIRGAITGSLAGEFKESQMIQHGGTSLLYGISNGLNMISQMASSSISSCATYAKLCAMTDPKDDLGNFLNPAKMWTGFACSIASPIFGFLADLNDPISYEEVPGKIDLNLDASVELAGQITTTTSNSFHALGVSTDAIKTANGPDGHMGKGVWGLEDDPVVYIDKDVILSSKERVNFVKRGDNLYSHTDIASYELRALWFFDPTSVKINLNTDLFPDVEKVYLTTTCGVYPSRPTGNTDAYRAMLTYKPRPVVDISNGKGVGKLVTLKTSGTTPWLYVITPKNVVTQATNHYQTVANSEMVDQPVADSETPAFHFYGKLEHELGQDIMVDPQIFLPYSKSGDTYLFNGVTAPDLVISVSIVFESQGSTFHFSKLYIPRIELIDHGSAWKNFYGSKNERILNDYYFNCREKRPTGYLNNKPNVPVYSPDGDFSLDRAYWLYGVMPVNNN